MSECELCNKEDVETCECTKCSSEFCNSCGDSENCVCDYCKNEDDVEDFEDEE